MPININAQMLAWLSARREMVNEMIVAASPQEEGQYLGELQIINAIAECVKREKEEHP